METTNKQVMINNTQFWTLLASSLWPTVIGYGGGIMAREAGSDMWLGGIFAIITAAALMYILIHVRQKFRDQTVVEYGHKLLGKIPSKVLGLLLFAYFFLGAHQSAAIYIHHINDFLLPETPFMVITVVHVLVICYLVWLGPEVIARLGVIAFMGAVFFCAGLCGDITGYKYRQDTTVI